MFAQPFVENAIEHGIGQVNQGRIDIAFRGVGNQLVLEVIDNGVGIKQDKGRDHRSLSTTIIHERMALLNKGNSRTIQLNITTPSSGVGTMVQVTLPIYS
jgi:LytS/YehU family sensor histidine kinase